MRGQACYHLFSTCFTILTTYAFPVGLQSLAWRFYLIWVPWVLVEIFVVWLVFPETKGPSLEEIAIIFDVPGAEGLDVEKLEVEVEQEEERRTVEVIVPTFREWRYQHRTSLGSHRVYFKSFYSDR